MGSKEKYFAIQTGAHGFDDIGFAQATGTITAAAKWGVPGKNGIMAILTANAAHLLTRGQQVNVAGTTDYDGPVIVLAIVSTTKFVIKKPFTVTKTGTWDVKAGDGNWDAIMATGADLTAANIAVTYWNPDRHGANELATNLTKDVIYPLQGIKTIVLTTAGNVRLFRAASFRPGTRNNPTAAVITGYSPSSAAVGATIDILGYNFTMDSGRITVKFNGTIAYPVWSTENKITVPVPVGATTGTVTVQIGAATVVTGPSFTVL